MATSWGAAASAGIESGFRMGMEADAAAQRKTQFEDSSRRADAAAARADQEFGLRKQKLEQEQDDRAAEIIGQDNASIKARSADRVRQGLGVDPADAERYGQNQTTLGARRQKALDVFSKMQVGRIDAGQIPDGDFYMHLTAATGMLPNELGKMPEHIANVQTGMETGNQGLLVQGVNGLMAPQLRQGVGGPSPYGGTIVKKEVIGLDPAIDANGKPYPGKFIPRLRVYVREAGTDDQDADQAPPKYYDAPLTQNRSTDPNDQVKAIDIKQAMDHMGQLGVLANGIQQPAFAAKIANGEKIAGADAKRYIEELTASAAQPAATKGQTGERLATVEAYAKKNGVSMQEASDALIKMGVLMPPAGTGAVSAKLANIDALPISDEQKTSLKQDVILGAGGKTTGLTPIVVGKNSRVVSAGSGAFTVKTSILGGGGSSSSSSSTGGGSGKVIGAETSQGPISVATAKKGSSTFDTAVEFWARAVISGDKDWQVGLSRSKEGGALIAAVKARVPTMAGELGLTPQDIGTTRAQSAALSKTLADRTKYVTAVTQLNDVLHRQAAIVEGMLDKATGPTGMPVIDKWVQAGRKATGDADVAAFDVAIRGLAREHQRVLTSPMSNAALHVSSEATADELLNRAQNPETVRKIIGVMYQEAENGAITGRETLARVTEQMRALGGGRAAGVTGGDPMPATGGVGPAAGGAAPAAAAAPAPAAPAVGTLKGGYKFKGGNPADAKNWEKQ